MEKTSQAEELVAAHKYLDEKQVARTTNKGSVLPLWYRISLLQDRTPTVTATAVVELPP